MLLFSQLISFFIVRFDNRKSGIIFLGKLTQTFVKSLQENVHVISTHTQGCRGRHVRAWIVIRVRAPSSELVTVDVLCRVWRNNPG